MRWGRLSHWHRNLDTCLLLIGSGVPCGVAFPWGAHPPHPFSVYIHLLMSGLCLVDGYPHVTEHCGVKGRLTGTASLLPPCEPQESNLGSST